MRAGPEVSALGIPAQQVGNGREPLEILGLQSGLVIRGRQVGERLFPSPAPVSLPAAIKRVRHTPVPRSPSTASGKR
jgi:hypothetical protein